MADFIHERLSFFMSSIILKGVYRNRQGWMHLFYQVVDIDSADGCLEVKGDRASVGRCADTDDCVRAK